jgi:hypothetical protein
MLSLWLEIYMESSTTNRMSVDVAGERTAWKIQSREANGNRTSDLVVLSTGMRRQADQS